MSNETHLSQLLADPDATIVLDGGLATELERLGCDISNALWSAEILINQPQLIEDVHLAFFKAGANVAITASYQASVDGLMKHKPDLSVNDAKELIQRSVQLAKNARSKARSEGITHPLLIAGSVGPYGAFLADGSEYRGDYDLSEEDFMDFHQPRIEALVHAGVDALAIETIPSFKEASALLRSLQRFSGIECWFSFTLKDERHISDGTPLDEVVQLLGDCEQIYGIGINCVPPNLVERALNELRLFATKALVVYPNSGEDYDATTKTWTGQRLQDKSLETDAQKWRSLGARLIGGCCRMTSDDIRCIRAAFAE